MTEEQRKKIAPSELILLLKNLGELELNYLTKRLKIFRKLLKFSKKNCSNEAQERMRDYVSFALGGIDLSPLSNNYCKMLDFFICSDDFEKVYKNTDEETEK